MGGDVVVVLVTRLLTPELEGDGVVGSSHDMAGVLTLVASGLSVQLSALGISIPENAAVGVGDSDESSDGNEGLHFSLTIKNVTWGKR